MLGECNVILFMWQSGSISGMFWSRLTLPSICLGLVDLSFADISKTSTSWPSLCNSRAQVVPAIPAPTTAIFVCFTLFFLPFGWIKIMLTGKRNFLFNYIQSVCVWRLVHKHLSWSKYFNLQLQRSAVVWESLSGWSETHDAPSHPNWHESAKILQRPDEQEKGSRSD